MTFTAHYIDTVRSLLRDAILQGDRFEIVRLNLLLRDILESNEENKS